MLLQSIENPPSVAAARAPTMPLFHTLSIPQELLNSVCYPFHSWVYPFWVSIVYVERSPLSAPHFTASRRRRGARGHRSTRIPILAPLALTSSPSLSFRLSSCEGSLFSIATDWPTSTCLVKSPGTAQNGHYHLLYRLFQLRLALFASAPTYHEASL